METFKDHSHFSLVSNPVNYIGYSIKHFHRVLFFTTTENKHLNIDFIPLRIEEKKLYIIPAGHILYLPPIFQNFYCINFKPSTLTDLENLWIFGKKYSNIKIIDSRIFFLKDFLNIQTISDIFEYDFIKKAKKIPAQYIYKARLINTFLHSENICHKTTVGIISENIFVTEKTLLRICKTIYLSNPRKIIQYHLALKCFLHMLHNKEDSISSIATKFNFEEVSTFTRFIKATTNHSPKEIKRFILKLYTIFCGINLEII